MSLIKLSGLRQHKVFVAETVNRVVDRATQICGALGMSDDLPLNLFYREVRPFRIYDSASEVHRAAVARRILRRAAKEDRPWWQTNPSRQSRNTVP